MDDIDFAMEPSQDVRKARSLESESLWTVDVQYTTRPWSYRVGIRLFGKVKLGVYDGGKLVSIGHWLVELWLNDIDDDDDF